jgi:hypothetical protein
MMRFAAYYVSTIGCNLALTTISGGPQCCKSYLKSAFLRLLKTRCERISQRVLRASNKRQSSVMLPCTMLLIY